MSDQPPQVPRDLPLTITMTVTEWQTLLNQLATGPFNVVGPLIGHIQRSCNDQIARAARPNGAANAVPEVVGHG